jgi:beta-glucosidase
MYYPPFEGAIQAKVGSMMCSYNLIDVTDGTGNGVPKAGERWSCENNETLGHLKKTLGFEGWVMSDWGATHAASIMEGLDQEMPGGSKMKNVLGPLVLAGNISTKAVDASVMRILTPMFQVGLFDRDPAPHGSETCCRWTRAN